MLKQEPESPMRTPTAILLVAIAAAAGEAPLRAQPAEEIILADPAFSLTFSAGYVASDLGLWQKHGVNVKTVSITGIGAINSVISGSSHFAQASASSFGRASARGQKLVAIATTIDRPFAQVVLRKDIAEAGGFDPKAPLGKRGALLKGRTIAVDSINSMIHAYVRLIAARGGINPDDIRVAPMAPASMLAAFESKQIDGYAMSLPWPQKAVQDGTALLIASGPDGEPGDMIPFGHNLIVTRQDTCAQKRALCLAIGQSIKDATAFIKTKPEEAFALLKKRFPTLDDALMRRSFEELQKVTPSPPTVSRALIENSETFNVDAGLLKADEKLKSYDGLFTNEFVQ
jgi:ABC-type nitrate/sulfonate/bicarbonate transport system substrate-binding protein